MDSFRIDHVAKLTGLSKHVIRSWEKRFGILEPKRGENRYRAYDQEDVDLLIYLNEQIGQGYSIGELAAAGRGELLRRMRAAQKKDRERSSAAHDRILDDLVNSLSPFQRQQFDRRFNEAVALLPFEEVFFKILIPLQHRVGDMWADGIVGVGVEHFVTQQVRQKFMAVLNHLRTSEDGPKIVVVCPPEELHEMGAQTAAYLCALHGCHPHYLGAQLPVKELAAFCTLVHPNLVLLSASNQMSDDEAKALAREYQEQVLPNCPMWAGGQAMKTARSHFEAVGIDVLDDMDHLESRLKRIAQFLHPPTIKTDTEKSE
ncbi:putative Regulatory protein, MerR family, Cobalamin B12-binding [Nitrospina gracilis 3/211]|uniref:Putative Regulatory protein, MerR family, Cobalamin B12-binding n=1 Tax=Nitrospina gracilis (strain 3/211) TaxID=1266370 RepID=M1YX97_NITG3|nr:MULTISPECIES: MerR family transcriptional regulator [Nitrospina]MCF8723072.1 DNA-binding transcriptional MerR regulator/methylmalonyl-CoA mutase cobalamin-binding subunit [Nitrospina sp. Nb-3]CCQ90109.1 putative Regulatory protein, MerR family, Cobalamin B12-binding [Nitrospina gracilis 3/211]